MFEELIAKHKLPVGIILAGFLFLGIGVFLLKEQSLDFGGSQVEVLGNAVEEQDNQETVVEVAGEVNAPGIYTLAAEKRVGDALEAAGGLTSKADLDWIAKSINKASKLVDAQKIYIPQLGSTTASKSTGTQTASFASSAVSGNLININSGTATEIESLPGIGPVYAKNIIEHRPYSTIDDLVKKGVIKEKLFSQIKNFITAF